MRHPFVSILLPSAISSSLLTADMTFQDGRLRPSEFVNRVNGRDLRTISTVPRSGFTGSPTLLRVGKMDKNGSLSDYKLAAVLVDSHMIGGDPAKLEPYGWASWIPGEAIVAVRNPDDAPKSITIEEGDIFELPADAPRSCAPTSAYKDQRLQSLDLEAGKPVTIGLQPFEVLVFHSARNSISNTP